MDIEGGKSVNFQKFTLGPAFSCLEKISLYETRLVSNFRSLVGQSVQYTEAEICGLSAEVLFGWFEQQGGCIPYHQDRSNGAPTTGSSGRQGGCCSNWGMTLNFISLYSCQ